MKYKSDLNSPVDHFYLGKYLTYKVWQEVEPLSNEVSPGRARYVLVENEECIYPQEKWSNELTKFFFGRIEKICLKFCVNFSNIHYLGMYDNDYVWEVWNIHDRSRECALPHLVCFNGHRYSLIQDRQETLMLVDYFLKNCRLSS